MRIWAKRAIAAVFTGGLIVLGTGIASAVDPVSGVPANPVSGVPVNPDLSTSIPVGDGAGVTTPLDHVDAPQLGGLPG